MRISAASSSEKLLEHVRETLVVELDGDLHAAGRRQVVQHLGDVGGVLPLELGDEGGGTLVGLGGGEAGDRGGVDHERLTAPEQPPGRRPAHEQLRDVPVPAAAQLEPEVLHASGPAAVGGGERDDAVEDLAHHLQLARPLLEAAHVEQTGRDDRARVHAGDPGERNEHAPPSGHLDDEADRTQRPARADDDDDVAHLPHPVPIGVVDTRPGEAGCKDSGRGAHASQRRPGRQGRRDDRRAERVGEWRACR